MCTLLATADDWFWHVEQAVVTLVMLLWMGGPLVTFFTPFLLFAFGTTTQLCYFLAIVLVLALHPLPNLEAYLNKSAFSMWICTFRPIPILLHIMHTRHTALAASQNLARELPKLPRPCPPQLEGLECM